MAAGICIFHVLSDGPASRRSTLKSGLADSRLARTHPADPAPMIMYSWVEENDVVDLEYLSITWPPG